MSKLNQLFNAFWKISRILIIYSLILISFTFLVGLTKMPAKDEKVAHIIPESDKEKSIQLFGEIAKVLKHPRCMNCHPSDNYPRQGDDSHRHYFNVQRGADNTGMVGMKCQSCHTAENNPVSGVPGAPKSDDPTQSSWHLAPLSMAWLGLTDAELGARLLDKNQNGGKSPIDLVEHMEHDPLVLWGWNPGGNRTPIPIPHKEFVKILKEWVETGAHVPKE